MRHRIYVTSGAKGIKKLILKKTKLVLNSLTVLYVLQLGINYFIAMISLR